MYINHEEPIDQLMYEDHEDPEQHCDINTNKYHNGQMYPITMISSEEEGTGCVGNIASLNGTNTIVKWSRRNRPDDIENFVDEISKHRAIHKIGLAPKILQVYQDFNSTYIFMENMVLQGYDLVANYDLDNNLVTDIANAFIKLHQNCIVHGDAHSYNIFYKHDTRSVKFIDFSYSKFCNTYNEAYSSECFDYETWYSDGFTHSKWSNIKKRYDKISKKIKS